MSLVALTDVSFGFSGPLLLDCVALRLELGERVCVYGRNGEGKSTLLQLVAGLIEPDEGERTVQRGLRCALLPQDVPPGLCGSIADVVSTGLEPGVEPWEADQAVDVAMGKVGLDGAAPFESLSGGMKRRALLARALVGNPDLLLLDEPTNHLDVDAIDWMERFLGRFGGALMFVTHDRVFLRALATRIVEIDRGRLTDWPGDFDCYLAGKQAALQAEAAQRAQFDKRLAAEERWIRQGIKARRTRNEGRVRRLEQMRRERSQRRSRSGDVRLTLQQTQKTGRMVIKAEQVAHRFDGPPVIADLSTTIMRGDRVGIIGANGSGKTTLLRIFCGDLTPTEGVVTHGTHLQIAYFDQLRETLDPELSVIDNVGEGRETVTVNGRSRPVIGYVQDFLFSPDRARGAVRFLSGGERNRVLLAKLFTRPSNLLVLDEPTNDLDAATLELLEELLIEYDGTLLLVSHDRAFLDNVVTSTLVLEEGGRVGEFVGGYSDWVRQRELSRPAPQPKPKKAPPPPPARRPKRTYRQNQELSELPSRIEALEKEKDELGACLSQPDFYQREGGEIAETINRLKAIEQELAEGYERWEELDALG